LHSVQLETRPARPFSATHTVRGCCGEVATLIVGAFRGGGELVLSHERYRISRDDGFVLQGPDGVIATAHAAGGRCFEIECAGRRLTVEPAPSPRHAYVVSEGVAHRGAVRRRTPSVRGIEVELTAEVPFPVQLFIAWLMLIPASRLV
jgi:hypothetical protein